MAALGHRTPINSSSMFNCVFFEFKNGQLPKYEVWYNVMFCTI